MNPQRGDGYPPNLSKSPEGFHLGAIAEVENRVLKPPLKKKIQIQDVLKGPPTLLYIEWIDF